MAEQQVPEEAVRALQNYYGDDLDDPENYWTERGAIEAALPALRGQWELEALEAMRSPEVFAALYRMIGQVGTGFARSEVVEQIIAYLTSPQVKVCECLEGVPNSSCPVHNA